MFDHSKQSWSSEGLDPVRLFSGIFSASCSLPHPHPKLELVVALECGRLLKGDHTRPAPYQEKSGEF